MGGRARASARQAARTGDDHRRRVSLLRRVNASPRDAGADRAASASTWAGVGRSPPGRGARRYGWRSRTSTRRMSNRSVMTSATSDHVPRRGTATRPRRGTRSPNGCGWRCSGGASSRHALAVGQRAIDDGDAEVVGDALGQRGLADRPAWSARATCERRGLSSHRGGSALARESVCVVRRTKTTPWCVCVSLHEKLCPDPLKWCF